MADRPEDKHAAWLGLTGKVCVVTGAAGGIGKAIARSMATAGAVLALLDRDAAGLEAFAKELGAAGVKAAAFSCDVTDEVSVAAAAEGVAVRLGAADVLVNNAGMLRPGPLADLDLAAWNQTLAVNLTGYFLCARAFSRPMLARGSGAMVHIASIAAHEPQGYSGAYSPSKAGVAMLSRQIALEWGPGGIRSNAVGPGMVRTPMSESFYQVPGVVEARSAIVPSRRVGRPEDIAEAVLWLASPRAGYVNGAEIMVDGGVGQVLMQQLPRPGYEAKPSN